MPASSSGCENLLQHIPKQEIKTMGRQLLEAEYVDLFFFNMTVTLVSRNNNGM